MSDPNHPPAGNYPPPGGGYGYAQSVVYTGPIVPGQPHPVTSDEKTMGMLAHILGAFTGFLGPLIIMLTKGKESPWVKDQSTEALNFALTVLILSIPTCGVAALVGIIFQIVAGLKANETVAYRYPLNFRMVK